MESTIRESIKACTIELHMPAGGLTSWQAASSTTGHSSANSSVSCSYCCIFNYNCVESIIIYMNYTCSFFHCTDNYCYFLCNVVWLTLDCLLFCQSWQFIYQKWWANLLKKLQCQISSLSFQKFYPLSSIDIFKWFWI